MFKKNHDLFRQRLPIPRPIIKKPLMLDRLADPKGRGSVEVTGLTNSKIKTPQSGLLGGRNARSLANL